MGLINLAKTSKKNLSAPKTADPIPKSRSEPRINSDEIKQQLQSINDSVPYFEGLPAVEFEHKENTWGNVFKGIFSSHNTKWKSYIMHTLNRRESGSESTKRKNQVKRKIDKAIRRIDTIIELERERPKKEAVHHNLVKDQHRLLNHFSKPDKYDSLASVLKTLNKFDLERKKPKYERKIPDFKLRHSFLELNLKMPRHKGRWEEDISEQGVRYEQKLMKSLHLLRRNSCCCSYCGVTKVSAKGFLKEFEVQKQKYAKDFDQRKNKMRQDKSESFSSASDWKSDSGSEISSEESNNNKSEEVKVLKKEAPRPSLTKLIRSLTKAPVGSPGLRSIKGTRSSHKNSSIQNSPDLKPSQGPFRPTTFRNCDPELPILSPLKMAGNKSRSSNVPAPKTTMIQNDLTHTQNEDPQVPGTSSNYSKLFSNRLSQKVFSKRFKRMNTIKQEVGKRKSSRPRNQIKKFDGYIIKTVHKTPRERNLIKMRLKNLRPKQTQVSPVQLKSRNALISSMKSTLAKHNESKNGGNSFLSKITSKQMISCTSKGKISRNGKIMDKVYTEAIPEFIKVKGKRKSKSRARSRQRTAFTSRRSTKLMSDMVKSQYFLHMNK